MLYSYFFVYKKTGINSLISLNKIIKLYIYTSYLIIHKSLQKMQDKFVNVLFLKSVIQIPNLEKFLNLSLRKNFFIYFEDCNEPRTDIIFSFSCVRAILKYLFPSSPKTSPGVTIIPYSFNSFSQNCSVV